MQEACQEITGAGQGGYAPVKQEALRVAIALYLRTHIPIP